MPWITIDRHAATAAAGCHSVDSLIALLAALHSLLAAQGEPHTGVAGVA